MFFFSHPAKQHVVLHVGPFSRKPLCNGKVFTWGSLWSHHKSKQLPLISLGVCAASLRCFLFLSRLMHKMVLWRRRWLIWSDLHSQHRHSWFVVSVVRKKKNPEFKSFKIELNRLCSSDSLTSGSSMGYIVMFYHLIITLQAAMFICN